MQRLKYLDSFEDLVCAGLPGEWWEEMIWRTGDNSERRIKTIAIPPGYGFVTPMNDPIDRLGIAS